MEVITFESAAFRELMEKIDSIANIVKLQTQQPEDNPDEMWVDGYDACTFLKISSRTLQRLRTNRLITYSVMSGKCYYTIGEIKRLLNEHRIRTTETRLEDLINNYKLYAQQRRNIKSDK